MNRRQKIQEQKQVPLPRMARPKLTRRQLAAVREQSQSFLPGLAPKIPTSAEIRQIVRAALYGFEIRQAARQKARDLKNSR